MVDRIRLLLQARQLSPTQFADAIGVARPIISHILGGRNKPSLEVVQKIIGAFPDVALPWLLAGQGPMLAQAPEAVTQPTATTSVSQASSVPVEAEQADVAPAAKPAAGPKRARSSNESHGRVPHSAQQPLRASEASSGEGVQGALFAPNGSVASALPVTEEVSVAKPLASAQAPVAPNPVPFGVVSEGKVIRRVVVFYQDGTFSDYRPAPEPM
jgi:transcriptional regulator with XRE-family HTH domain